MGNTANIDMLIRQWRKPTLESNKQTKVLRPHCAIFACPSCFHTRTQSEFDLAQTKKCGKMPSVVYGGPSLRMQIRDESRDVVKNQ